MVLNNMKKSKPFTDDALCCQDKQAFGCANVVQISCKEKGSALNQALPICICRDYWTRTSDLAPPRRVRYQLR